MELTGIESCALDHPQFGTIRPTSSSHAEESGVMWTSARG